MRTDELAKKIDSNKEGMDTLEAKILKAIND
jgi:hypothetical protein